MDFYLYITTVNDTTLTHIYHLLLLLISPPLYESCELREHSCFTHTRSRKNPHHTCSYLFYFYTKKPYIKHRKALFIAKTLR